VGLYIRANSGTVVNFNNLINNAGAYELQNGGGGSVNAKFNYWGALVTSEMEGGINPKNITGIYDIYDDTAKGAVVYDQWLAQAVTLPDAIVSHITQPVNESSQKNPALRIQGVAVSPLGISYVEVSTDGGINWDKAEGSNSWYYDWTMTADGSYTLYSRAIYSGEHGDLIEISTDGVVVTLDSTLPTTSGQLTADETWTGEVLLTGDVTVPSGLTLTIEPGTSVKFIFGPQR
jgi:hypothetical protein